MSHKQQGSGNLTLLTLGYNASFNGTGSNITFNLQGDRPWEPFPMPVWLEWSYWALFLIIVLPAIVLNCMVIGIVLCDGNMRRNVTNYPILSLALADLLTSVCNTPWNFYYMMYNNWRWGELFCKIDQFLSNAFIAASAFTLLATGIDRYRVLCRTLGTIQAKAKMVTILLGIWGISLAVSTPNLYHYLLYRADKRTTRHTCKWDEDLANAEFLYDILFLTFIYFLPTISMLYCYYRVCKLLWNTRVIGELTDAQIKIKEDRKRMIKMLVIVVLSFAIGWLPFNVYFVVDGIWPSVKRHKFSQIIFISFYWLAMLNSTLNPLIYYTFLPNFRQRFKKIFKYIFCLSCLTGSRTIGIDQLDQYDNSRTLPSSRNKGSCNLVTMDTFVSQKHSLDALTDETMDPRFIQETNA